jgi:hypothetical protein
MKEVVLFPPHARRLTNTVKILGRDVSLSLFGRLFG